MQFNKNLDWLKEDNQSDELLNDDELDMVEEELNEGLYVDPSNYGNYTDLVDVVDNQGNPQKMTQQTYTNNKGSKEFTVKEPENKLDKKTTSDNDFEEDEIPGHTTYKDGAYYRHPKYGNLEYDANQKGFYTDDDEFIDDDYLNFNDLELIEDEEENDDGFDPRRAYNY